MNRYFLKISNDKPIELGKFSSMTGTSLVNLFSRAVLGVLSNTDVGALTTENELVK
jgi:hypothetical protein